MFRIIILLCAVLAVRGQTTQVSQCTANAGELPINTYIEGCITPPCLLPQLQDAVINMVFRAPRTMTSMTTRATAYLGFIPINYNLGDNAVTCNFLTNSFCPVIEGEVLQYTLNMFIERFMPAGTQVTIEFRVEDENNSAFACIRVPIRIVEAVEGRLAGDDKLQLE